MAPTTALRSLGHLLSEYLSISRNLEMTHVPYKGRAPCCKTLWAVTSLGGSPFLGRHAPISRPAACMLLPSPDQRSVSHRMPDVPTFTEASLRDGGFKSWAASSC
ncbi:MAG: hypothetical protein IPO11_20115 [Betaproteobacteria bacterium]|nr:hypothetical protein [Betaproteobacteria bacterium]